MIKFDQLPPLREVITTYGLTAHKHLGQNYLLDSNITDKIARLAGPLSGYDVLEIGPGPGGLTRSLIQEGARRVVAVEKDSRFIPALNDLARVAKNLQVIHGDAFDLNLAFHLTNPIKIVSNLPFNSATGLLTRWLESPQWPPFWESMTLMFQQETALRIIAGPGSKSYGRLSILAQWRANTRLVMKISSTAFVPRPKVNAAVIRIDHLNLHTNAPEPLFLSSLTKAAFGQRRKMLRTSLKNFHPQIESHLKKLGLAPDTRPESLSVDEFCLLARLLQIPHTR